MSLHAIQQKLNVPKNQQNSFGGFNYRSLEDILDALKPVLEPFEYSVTFDDQMVEVGGRVYVEATCFLRDKDFNVVASAKANAREPEKKPKFDDSQLTGSASSYARKYAASGLFAIDDTKDADTDAYTQATKESKPPKKTRKQAAEEETKLNEFKQALDESGTQDVLQEVFKDGWNYFKNANNFVLQSQLQDHYEQLKQSFQKAS